MGITKNRKEDEKEVIEEKISDLKEKLEVIRLRIAVGEQLVLFGAGEKAVGVVDILKQNNIQIFCFCDNDIRKQGSEYLGYKVKNLKELGNLPVFFIVCTVINYFEEIKHQLTKLKKSDIYHMCTPYRVDNTFLDYKELCENREAYDKLYKLFADEYSKELFIKCLTYKMDGDGEELLSMAYDTNIFDPELINPNINHTYVDCGAFTGDTLIQFCFFCRGLYKEIIAIEADQHNCDCIEKLIEYARLNNCTILNKGCWECKTELKFFTYETHNQTTYENGDVCVLNKNSKASINNKKLCEEIKVEKTLSVDTVDKMAAYKHPTIIKINTVSSDYQTLKGCFEIMKKIQPAIVIEFGTRPQDILTIPELIMAANPNYKLYLRQKKVFLDSKTILYAI